MEVYGEGELSGADASCAPIDANLPHQGNPCCEEPDYRLHVIHRIPSVHVLDQHVVTDQERFDARTQIGGDISALTIAFGKRIPMPEEWWMAKVRVAGRVYLWVGGYGREGRWEGITPCRLPHQLNAD